MAKLPELPRIPPEKKFFKISEAVTLCGVRQDVLRFWESEIPALRPIRRGNQRRYRPQDILLVRKIRELRYGKGLSIEGVISELKKEREGVTEELAPLAAPPISQMLSKEMIRELQEISSNLKETAEFLRNK